MKFFVKGDRLAKTSLLSLHLPEIHQPSSFSAIALATSG